MYLIKKIKVDDKLYLSSHIVNHTGNKQISQGIKLLESAVRNFVREEIGRDASENSKIIDIHSLDQVSEPLIDGILLYRLDDNPHQIHVYQRKTVITKQTNWTWGTSDVPVTTYKRVYIFELEEYENITAVGIEEIEMINYGPARIRIPKKMTLEPMSLVITELKCSDRFKKRLELNQ